MAKYKFLFMVIGVILLIAVLYLVLYTEAPSDEIVEPPLINSIQ